MINLLRTHQGGTILSRNIGQLLKKAGAAGTIPSQLDALQPFVVAVIFAGTVNSL